MDEQVVSDEPDNASPGDGIYATCGLCFAIVAAKTAHEAWHESRGETVNDANN